MLQEIKHTIQNKLHRNAGPEDLVATERLVERLEGEGHHPQEFMDQLRIFRAELRDFFNASSFTDMLQAVRPSMDDSDIPVRLYCFLCWPFSHLISSVCCHLSGLSGPVRCIRKEKWHVGRLGMSGTPVLFASYKSVRSRCRLMLPTVLE